MTKIIDLINNKEGDVFLSLEYFPPRTDEGVKNLLLRMERMKTSINPLFTDMTWGAGGSTADLSLKLALEAHNTGHVSNMHLTCTNMTKNGDPIAGVRDALSDCHKGGIRNIVALRGDPPSGQETWTADEGGFTCALDLVKYIRKNYGDVFGISVAGYPEGHPNAITTLEKGQEESMSATEKARCSVFDGVTSVCRDEDYDKELNYLKEKIDAGADFIITQMFLDVKVFTTFVDDCRKKGINCPIVPGLMCLNAYRGFKKMTKFCKTRVPIFLEKKMESLQDDDNKVKEYGVEFGIQMCKELMESGAVGLHFYTLNLEKVVYGILDGLNLTKNLSKNSNETDANTMAAVGSAWARVGDSVRSVYGTGIVIEIRSGGVAVVQMDKWQLAKDQRPVAYLQRDSYTKVFA